MVEPVTVENGIFTLKLDPVEREGVERACALYFESHPKRMEALPEKGDREQDEVMFNAVGRVLAALQAERFARLAKAPTPVGV